MGNERGRERGCPKFEGIEREGTLFVGIYDGFGLGLSVV